MALRAYRRNPKPETRSQADLVPSLAQISKEMPTGLRFARPAWAGSLGRPAPLEPRLASGGGGGGRNEEVPRCVLPQVVFEHNGFTVVGMFLGS